MTEERCTTCGQSLAGSPFSGLDWADFGLQVRLAMARKNISYRQLADAIGSDQATVHRVAKHGKPIRAETYLALLDWVAASERILAETGYPKAGERPASKMRTATAEELQKMINVHGY